MIGHPNNMVRQLGRRNRLGPFARPTARRGLAIVLAMQTRGVRPPGYRVVAAAAAVLLMLSYLSLEVRTLYHGPVLRGGGTTSAEQYTYSAVWLAFGVALLAAGVFLRSQAVRFASASACSQIWRGFLSVPSANTGMLS